MLSLKKLRSMLDETTIALMMHCWLNMSMERSRRKVAVRSIFDLFSEKSCDDSSDVLDIAVRSVSLEAIISKAKITLYDPQIIDEALEEELKALQVFCLVRRPWTAALIDSGLHLDIAYALQRQRKYTLDHSRDDAVVDMGGHVIRCALMIAMINAHLSLFTNAKLFSGQTPRSYLRRCQRLLHRNDRRSRFPRHNTAWTRAEFVQGICF